MAVFRWEERRSTVRQVIRKEQADIIGTWEAAQSAVKYELDNLIVFVDDNGLQIDGPTEEIMPRNYILDCKFEQILNPGKLHNELIMLTGVIETGLFIEMTGKLLVGRKGNVEVRDAGTGSLSQK